jgi:hypothetical protein
VERGRDAAASHDDEDEDMKGRGGFAILTVLGVVAGCASAGGRVANHDDATPTLAPAPWSGVPIDPALVPQPYLTAWNAAENRASCALLAPRDAGRPEATARRATFSGGWGVAYDLPDLRSAFGVAGTGASAEGDVYDDWPHELEWADGSRAGYGPEGGTGENQLAYVTIPGQTCLYNVWSRLGVEHLELLLSQLRFVS